VLVKDKVKMCAGISHQSADLDGFLSVVNA